MYKLVSGFALGRTGDWLFCEHAILLFVRISQTQVDKVEKSYRISQKIGATKNWISDILNSTL